MSDYQNIADQIRAFVTAADQTKTPELVDLAAAYASLCNETNARLRRCTDLIHRGLRAEATHLADEHPVLLEVVAALDLPEAAEWASVCATYELVRPPPLLMEAAQELNEAYALAQPAEALLYRLRRLALDRGPLTERIAVMRKLSKIDTTSMFWDQDIQTFETVRLKEIKVESARAIESNDGPALARLLAEVNAPDWRLPPNADLRARLVRAETSNRQEGILRQIRAMVPDLETAYGAMNFEAVTGTLMQIRGVAAQNKVSLPADVLSRMQPVEQWVAQQNAIVATQQRLAEACAALSTAVNEDAPIPRLESLRREAEALGSVPEELALRVRNAIDRQKSRQRTRALVRAVAIAASVVVVVAAGVLSQRQMSRNSRGQEVASKLSTLLDSGTPDDLDTANQYVKQVAVETPYVLERDDVKKNIDQLKAAEEAEKDRTAAAASDLASAKAALDNAVAQNVPTVAVWNNINAMIDNAGHSARSSGEKSAVSDLRDRASAANRHITANEEQRIRQSLADLTAKTASMREAVNAGAGTVKDVTLSSIMQQVADVKTSALAAGLEAPQASAQSLADQLTEVRNTLARQNLESGALETVKQSATTPQSLAEALLAFGARCPESEHAQRFKNAAANAGLWGTVQATSKLIDSWAGVMKPEEEMLPDRAREVGGYLQRFPDSPWRTAFEDYGSYLKSWMVAVADEGPWKKGFRELLTLPLLKDRMCCQGINGKTYYLPPNTSLESSNAGVTFSYMTSSAYILSGDTKALKTVRVQPGWLNGGAVLSPQSVLSADLDKQAASVGADWETFGCTTAVKIAGATQVDPVLRVILLSRELKFAKFAAWGGDEAITKFAAGLDPLDADEINWMDPDDDLVAGKRQQAVQLLADMSDLKKAGDGILARRDAVFQRMTIGIIGSGLLLKEKTGWTITTGVSAEPGRTVFATTGKQGWFKIADVRDGKFVVNVADVSEDADSLDGSMIFVCDARK
jgi:hypothetical protein